MGAADPLILTCGALCLLCSGLFIIRELTTVEPFLTIRIFSKWQFTAALGAYLMVNIIFMGVIYLLQFYLTLEMHFDLATSGFCLLIPPAVIATSAYRSGSCRTGMAAGYSLSRPPESSSYTAPSSQYCHPDQE